MTLLPVRRRTEVGVRDLHDHLSRHLKAVEAGDEVIVTMRGKKVARITAIDQGEVDVLGDLRARGVIAEPGRALRSKDLPPPIKASATVSDLVTDLRD